MLGIKPQWAAYKVSTLFDVPFPFYPPTVSAPTGHTLSRPSQCPDSRMGWSPYLLWCVLAMTEPARGPPRNE